MGYSTGFFSRLQERAAVLFPGKRKEKGANQRVRMGGGNRAIPEVNEREFFVCRCSMPFWVFSRKS